MHPILLLDIMYKQTYNHSLYSTQPNPWLIPPLFFLTSSPSCRLIFIIITQIQERGETASRRVTQNIENFPARFSHNSVYMISDKILAVVLYYTFLTKPISIFTLQCLAQIPASKTSKIPLIPSDQLARHFNLHVGTLQKYSMALFMEIEGSIYGKIYNTRTCKENR